MLNSDQEQSGKHGEAVGELSLKLGTAQIDNRGLKVIGHSPRNLTVRRQKA